MQSGRQAPMRLKEQLWSKDARAARSSYVLHEPVTRLRSELSESRPWAPNWPKPFENLLDLLPSSEDTPAIYTCSPDRRAGGQPLTHRMLGEFIRSEFNIDEFGLTRGDRCAMLLPNCPELAVCFLSIACWCTVAPLNPKLTKEEMLEEIRHFNCSHVVIHSELLDSGVIAREVLDCAKTIVLMPDASIPGKFTLRKYGDWHSQSAPKILGVYEDIAMLIHTSGTTSKPKSVPLTHRQLGVCATCILSTLRLTQNDVCLNMMPFYHTHSITTNLLASLFAGAGVVCAAGYPFDQQELFFKWVLDCGVTWYSAVPTMHFLVVQSANMGLKLERDRQQIKAQIRIVRSGSASLLKKTQEDLEEIFGSAKSPCAVIQFYATSEANPITCNPIEPLGHEYQKPGSVGKPAGLEVKILDIQDDEQGTPLHAEEILPGTRDGGVDEQGNPTFKAGEICVRGVSMIRSYEGEDDVTALANAKSFVGFPTASENRMPFEGPDDPESGFGGWFRTGDSGYLDEDGYLRLVGRLKEIINRGGEVISPFEIDEAINKHPDVKEVLSFAVKHKSLGETIGIAVVLQADAKDLSASSTESKNLLCLRKWINSQGDLGQNKIPECIRIVQEIPKGQTGKPQRIGLDRKLGVEEMGMDEDLMAVSGDESDNSFEETVKSILMKAVGLDSLELTDTFADMGVDSLARLRLYNGLKTQLKRKSIPQDIFARGDTTVQDLIDALSGDDGNQASEGTYFDAAGGLRALCILSMVTYHADAYNRAWPAYLDQRRCLFRFPMFFLFVLSGYEVQSIYCSANGTAWRAFFIGRMSFLFPLYWLCLLIQLPQMIPMVDPLWEIIMVYILAPFALQSLTLGGALWGDHLWYVSTLWVLSWFAPLLTKWANRLEVKSCTSVCLIISGLILCFPLWDVITHWIGPLFSFRQGCPLSGHDKRALVEWEFATDPGMVCSATGVSTYGDPSPGMMYYEENTLGVGSMSESVGGFWFWWTSPIGRFPTFAIGFVMARFQRTYDGPVAGFFEAYGHWVVDISALLVVGSIMLIPYHGYADNNEMVRTDWYDPGTLALEGVWPTVLICVWIYATTRSKRASRVNKYFLSNRYLTFLGSISYEMYLFHLPIYRYYLWFKAVPTDTNIHFCSVFFDTMTYQEMWALIAVTIIVASVMHDIAEDYRQGTNACVESLFTCCAAIGSRCARCCQKQTATRAARRRGLKGRAAKPSDDAADLLRESVTASDNDGRMSVIAPNV